MQTTKLTTSVHSAGEHAAVIDINGEVNAFCEETLMSAYADATGNGVRAVILNFGGLVYMNSGGIGQLVTLLIRAQRQNLRLMACGLSDHYRQIFELTRLDEAIGIFESEEAAVADSAPRRKR